LRFGRGRFNFKRKRLESDCGKYAIYWKLRAKPDEPIGPGNQQTSIGFVDVENLTVLEQEQHDDYSYESRS